jgi:hypothetical protein
MLKKIYLTYIKKNNEADEVYSGMASGNWDGKSEGLSKVLEKRDSSHHKNADNFGPAILDQFSEDKDAIRGREQMLIEHYGYAKSENGTSGNQINGISPRNKKKNLYLSAAIKLFGTISILLFLLHLVKR